MNRKILLITLTLVVMIAFVATSYASASPNALTANFSKDATSCGIWWFSPKWKPVWIEGTGHILQKEDGGLLYKCDFTLDLDNPKLLSRDQFCGEDWAKFMCQGDGALVDNRTTCNLENVEVHNGVVVAGPSGEGMFVCHVK